MELVLSFSNFILAKNINIVVHTVSKDNKVLILSIVWTGLNDIDAIKGEYRVNNNIIIINEVIIIIIFHLFIMAIVNKISIIFSIWL